MSAVELFTEAARLLAINPPHATNFSILARIANLGLVPGQEYDAGRIAADQIDEIEAGGAAAREAMVVALPHLGHGRQRLDHAHQQHGCYGNYFFKRAVVTLIGLGANPVEDAIYPILVTDADGDKISGKHADVIHFDADKLPPAAAFWSITM